jgi:hypothetical protein
MARRHGKWKSSAWPSATGPSATSTKASPWTCTPRSASTAPDATPGDAQGNAPVQKYGIEFTRRNYRKAPVTGGGKAGAVLSLTDNNTVYPVQAHAVLGKNKASIAGTLTDPRSLSGIDLQLSLAGASMADLYPLTGVLLPETPDYATKGRLLGKKDGDAWNWTYQDFKGTVGQSDLAGTLQYLPRQPRPLLRGEVTSQQLRLEDPAPPSAPTAMRRNRRAARRPCSPTIRPCRWNSSTRPNGMRLTPT